MHVHKSGNRVLWYESFGFGLILILCWINKIVDLPHLLVGGDLHASKWRDSTMETVLILLIWAFVHSLTRRLVARLHYLEGMLRVCAWCRKVGHGDRWMRLEEYFAEDFQIGTTHGVCPECLKALEEDTRRFYRSEAELKSLPSVAAAPAPESSRAPA
jgi:hypothetical protein